MSNFYNKPNEQIQFLTDLISIRSDTRILDIGCDNGYHLKELQKITPFCYGVDIKDPIKPLDNFIKANIFKDNLDIVDLDLAFCFAPYFGEDWWNLDTLFEKINKMLKLNGLFVLDLFNWNMLPVGRKWQEWSEMPDRYVLTKYEKQIDRVTGDRTILLSNWDKIPKEIVWRVLSEEEFSILCQKFGFVIRKTFGGFDTQTTGSFVPDGKIKRLIIQFEKIEELVDGNSETRNGEI